MPQVQILSSRRKESVMNKPKLRTYTYYLYEQVESYMRDKYGFNMDDRNDHPTVPKYKNSFWLEIICNCHGVCNGAYITINRDMLDDKSDYVTKIGEALFDEFGDGEFDEVRLYVGW